MRDRLMRVPENKDVGAGQDDSAAPHAAGSPRQEELQPVPVEVVESFSVGEIARLTLGPLMAPLGKLAIVVVFVIFMLLNREDLRNRVIRLLGDERLSSTTEAIDDAAYRVSRYLLAQLMINAAYGLVISIGLFLIGLPNAILWGVMTAVLRFVPYVGPWIAALIPIAISLAVFDGWLRPGLVLALFIVNELVSNNVIEPWLYGTRTGISTFGILAAAVFWTWIWGPMGLVLSTPMTVCLTVMGRYVPQMGFLTTLLSDEHPLAPPARLYQRLLALDAEEAAEVADEMLASSSLVNVYGELLLPALNLAEKDRHRGRLSPEKHQFVLQSMREIIDDLNDEANPSGRAPLDDQADSKLLEPAVICLPARDEADELAGTMLIQLLTERGFRGSVVSTMSLSGEMIEAVSEEPHAIVCISAVPPYAVTHARYLCKRLRVKSPDLKIVVGVWQDADLGKKTQERFTLVGVDCLTTSLQDAIQEIERLVNNSRMLNQARAHNSLA
jgi:hypothetical protein